MSALMTKAARDLDRKNAQLARIRREARESGRNLTCAAATLGGGAVAALIDEKFAGNEDEAKLANMPTNALVAAGALAVGAFVDFPGRRELACLGLGIGSAAIYNLVRDNVDLTD